MLAMPNLIREWKKVRNCIRQNTEGRQMLTRSTGWKTQLDQVPQINVLDPEGSMSCVYHVIPMYSCQSHIQPVPSICFCKTFDCDYALREGSGLLHGLVTTDICQRNVGLRMDKYRVSLDLSRLLTPMEMQVLFRETWDSSTAYLMPLSIAIQCYLNELHHRPRWWHVIELLRHLIAKISSFQASPSHNRSHTQPHQP
jgi:hypothetical protein